MYNKSIFQRLLSLVLCAVLVASCLPAGVLPRASAAGEASGVLIDKTVTDPSTLNAWADTAFNPEDLTTEHAGGVWTDKTVLKPGDIASAFPGVSGLNVQSNNLLVALSALGANSVIVGHDTTPTDVIFVLDVSNSMENTDLNSMVTAVNDSIHTLLTSNDSNRVGVVVYGTDADVLLPLDRYTPVQKGNGNNRTTAYIEMADNYGTIRAARTGSYFSTTYVTNSAGRDVTTSLSASGATYIQGGLWQAYQMFAAADVSGTRTPALVLMSDGAPTYGDTDYNNVGRSNVGNGTTNSVTDGVAFLTQLTAAYVKEKIADEYNTSAYFYSVGLGVDEGGNSVSIAEAVLDTSRTRQTPESHWSTYLGLANKSNKTMSFRGTSSNVTITYDSTVTAASKNYTNRYFPAEDASQLGAAFQGIVNEISLKASYNVTRIEGNNANTGGYVTFVDEIGTGMEVKNIKGILIGNHLYTGAVLAKAMKDGEFGTRENPTSLGDNLVWAVKERLRIRETANQTATERAWELLEKAWTAGQLSYTDENNWSNYIAWFGNENGEYVGFWDAADPDPVIPEGAAYANICYGMLGTTTESQTAHASDMMYVAIQVSKAITGGKIEANTPQTVTFRVPASLLPTVTYQIEVEAGEGEEINEQTPAKLTYIPAQPIRLLYEVGVHSQLTPLNIKEFLREGYQAKDADGNYYLYTNAWYWDGADASDWNNPDNHPDKGDDVLYDTTKNHITYAYFEPSVQNEHYYFTEDTDLYTRSGNSYAKLTTAPVTDGSVQYYFRHTVFTANATQTGATVNADVDIHYGAVEPKALEHAVRGNDGVYQIPQGTMHYGTIHDHDTLKGGGNPTGSFKYRMHQLVDIAVSSDANHEHHYEIAYLGNNGRISYAPAQGLKLSKVMNDGSKPDVRFTFEVALEGQDIAGVYETIHVAANGKETPGSENVVSDKITVELKPGESIYILGLTAGTEYTVTETKLDGYRLQDKQSDTGTIAENAIAEAVFTNAVQEYGALTVTKLVTYADNLAPTADNNEFPVTVTLKDGTADFIGTVQVGGTDYQVTDGKVSFNIKHGSRTVITGIPVGVIYTVAEGTLPAGYTWTNAGAATLTGAIDADGQIVQLTNAYDPQSVSVGGAVSVTVNKSLEVSFSEEGESYMLEEYPFNFLLQRYDAAIGDWVTLAPNATITIHNPAEAGSDFYGEGNKGTASIDMSDIPFDTAGSYFFRVKEDIPANLDTGWTYDRTHHDFEIVVTDATLDGQLEISQVKPVQHAEVTGGNGQWNVATEFENDYTVHSTKLTLAAKKSLTGATLKDGQFEFALYKTGQDFAITGDPITARNGVRGDIVFLTEPYPFVSGTTYYYYVMKELTTDGNGVTTDKTVWEIQVRVDGLDSGEAQIHGIQYRKKGETEWSGTVTGAPKDNIFNSIEFKNTYEAKSTTLAFSGNKQLTNVTPGIAQSAMTVPANTYKFKLEAVTSGAPMPNAAEVFAAAGGAFDFGNISYSAVGTYEYKVTEINTNVAGVTYDATVYTVKANVTDNGLGQLVAAATYWIDDVQVEEIAFHNTYKASATEQLNIHAVKVLNVGEGFDRNLRANDFRATLTHPDGTTETVFNDASGKFIFAPVSFDAVGTYNYSVAELVPHGAVNGKLEGMIYDTVAKVFAIEVTDGGNGKLVAKLNGTTTLSDTDSAQVATITNSYEADSVDVHLTAHKDLVGRDLVENEFTFKVEAITSGAPMPNATTAKNDANGDVDFGNITYTAIGTHQYKVTELAKDGSALTDGYQSAGVTYSQKVYTVTVEIVDLGNGKLHAAVSSLDEEGVAQPGGIVFTNTYEAASVEAEIEALKKLFDITDGGNEEMTVPASTYKFKLEALGDAPAPQASEVFAAAGGAISFGSIEFTEAGAYEYQLTEIEMNVPGVTTDDTVYTVIVTVKDDGQGQLSIESVTYNGEGAAIFENTYEAEPDEIPKTGVTMDGRWTLMMAVGAICGLAVLVLGKKKLLAE